MPTDRSSLTPRLLAIRQAVARGDYSCLAGGGEREVFAYARRCGIGADELLHEWAGHDAPVQAKRHGSDRKSSAAIAALDPDTRHTVDLDYWAEVEPVEPDDDEAGGEEPCAACDGSGRDDDGQPCEVCNGTGKVLAGDDGEDEKDDEV